MITPVIKYQKRMQRQKDKYGELFMSHDVLDVLVEFKKCLSLRYIIKLIMNT